MKPFLNSQSNMAFFGFDQSLSFPTAGQGNDDSGDEIVFELLHTCVRIDTSYA